MHLFLANKVLNFQPPITAEVSDLYRYMDAEGRTKQNARVEEQVTKE
jgi:hypothetical protein